MVVEGHAPVCRLSAWEEGRIAVPITEAIYAILYEGMDSQQAVRYLFTHNQRRTSLKEKMVRLEGVEVVTAAEMARVEKICYDRGASRASRWRMRGYCITECDEAWIQSHLFPNEVILLAGKGNKEGMVMSRLPIF